MASEWYLLRGTERVGPMDSQKLKTLAASGFLKPVDLVWKEGMAEPQQAVKINGLFSPSQSPAKQIETKHAAPPTQITEFLTPASDNALNEQKKTRLPKGMQASAPFTAKAQSLAESVLNNRLLHVFLIPFCCIGFVPIFISPAWSKAAKIFWAVGIAGLLAIGIAGMVIEQQEIETAVAGANSDWDGGRQADAVDKYRSILKKHWIVIDEPNRSTLVRRVVEFDVAHDNTDASAEIIDRMIQSKVNVTFESPKAAALVQELRAAAAKRDAEKNASAKTKNEKPAGAVAHDKEPAETDAMTAAELVSTFRNAAAAAQKYKGKRISVQGKVIKVDQGYASTSTFASKQYYAALGGVLGPRGYSTWVECYFSSEQEAAKIKPGSIIVIQGYADNGDDTVVRMTRCSYVGDAP